MAEGKLKPAAENPWYVLMTIHGEQDGDLIDPDLREKNRQAWNAWSCQNLSEERRNELAKSMPMNLSELCAWPEIEKDVVERFRNRLGQDAKLPDVEAFVDLIEVAFSNPVVMDRMIFHRISFHRADFSSRVSFTRSIFMQDATFNDATFARAADFAGVTFTEDSYFGNTRFSQHASFGGVTFGLDSYFGRATFVQEASFTDTRFTRNTTFHDSTFTQDARFNGATFTQDAWFDGATFMQDARFGRATFMQDARFTRVTFMARAHFIQTRFVGLRTNGEEFTPAQAIFRDCEFQRPVTFREAVFGDRYPDWTGAILPKNVEFTGANVAELPVKLEGGHDSQTETELVRLWPRDMSVEPEPSRESCAIMRHALNQQGLPEAEHFFYRKEMVFAEKSARWWEFWKWLPYWLYDGVSHYGYSMWRPFFLLLCLFAGGTWFYYGYFGSIDFQTTGLTVENRMVAAAGLSASNTIPGFAFGRTYYDRDFLATLDWPVKFAGGLQSVLGILLLFFLGLGLRTRFRLR